MIFFLVYLLTAMVVFIFWHLLISDQRRLKMNVFCPICDLPLANGKCLSCYPCKNAYDFEAVREEVNGQLREVTQATLRRAPRVQDHLEMERICAVCPEQECVEIPDYCQASRYFSE
jgi:hypothetical protein